MVARRLDEEARSDSECQKPEARVAAGTALREPAGCARRCGLQHSCKAFGRRRPADTKQTEVKSIRRLTRVRVVPHILIFGQY